MLLGSGVVWSQLASSPEPALRPNKPYRSPALGPALRWLNSAASLREQLLDAGWAAEGLEVLCAVHGARPEGSALSAEGPEATWGPPRFPIPGGQRMVTLTFTAFASS